MMEICFYPFFYIRFKEVDADCLGGCAYTKEDDASESVWCFATGPFPASNECPASSSKTSPLSTMEPETTSFEFLSSSTLIVDTPQHLPQTEYSSITTITITQPPPELQDEGTKTSIAFLENGEVIEQRDSFNNISGEAVLSVPPHGNMSELTVVLQPSTVCIFANTKNKNI